MTVSLDSRVLTRHTRWLQRLAVELIGDPHRAEDLVQDTWLAAVQQPPRQLADDRSLRSWLGRVMHNLSRAAHRAQVRRRRRERVRARDERTASVTDTLEREAAQRMLLDAVLGLGAGQREVIVLRYFEGLPPREIATRLGLSGGAVRSRLQRALHCLRTHLDTANHGDGRRWMLAVLPLAGRPLRTAVAHLHETLTSTSGSLMMGAIGTKTKVIGAAAVVLVAGIAVLSNLGPGTGAATVDPPDPTTRTAVDSGPRPVPAAPERVTNDPEPEPAKQAPAAKAAPDRITGRVRDLDGMPLGGATVGFEERSYSGTTRVGTRSRPEYSVTAAADGTFAMQRPDRQGYLVAGSATHVTLLDSAWTGAAEGADIVVAPRGEYGGVVSFEDGSPAKGQPLEFRPDPALLLRLRPGVPPSTEVVWHGTTDDQGGFAFRNVPFSAGTVIAVDRTGYEPARHLVNAAVDAAIRITLLRTRAEGPVHAIAGRVLFASGEPVADARVYFGPKIVRTSADGRFLIRLDEPHRGGEVLAATKGWLPVTEAVAAGQNPRTMVLTISERPLTISGRVVDGAGRPVAEAVVFTGDGRRVTRDGTYGAFHLEDVIDPIHRQGRPEHGRRRPVDSAGRFELSALLPGKYRVFAMHDRTLAAVSAGQVDAGTQGLEIVLDHGAQTRRVAGRVLSLAGQPLAGIRLFVGRRSEIDGAPFFAPLVTRGVPATDRDGRFEFRELCVEGTYLIPSGPTVVNSDRIRLDPNADLERLEFRLPTNCKLQVFLQDPDAADACSVLDAQGERLSISVHIANSMRSAPKMPLVKGSSEIIDVDERGRILVLWKGDEEVRRVDLQLVPGQTSIVRL